MSDPAGGRCLYFSNLPVGMSEGDLRALVVQRVGVAPMDVAMVRRRSLAIAFATLPTVKDAARAVAALHLQRFADRRIACRLARPRPGRAYASPPRCGTGLV